MSIEKTIMEIIYPNDHTALKAIVSPVSLK